MQAAKLAGPATLAVSGALLFVAFFFGDGISDGRLFWIGAFAALGAIVLLGWSVPVPRGLGLACLALLAALALWVGLTMAWSVAPDLSWAAFNRLLVYLAFALLGVLATQVRQPARTIAGGLALLLGLVLCWALLGKAIPSLFPDGARVARLRNPIGYWNSLALAAATAVPFSLWLASARGHARWVRMVGVLLLYVAELAVVLTYSRAGIAVAALAALGWVWVSRDRLESLAALAVATPVAGIVALWTFSRPALTDDLQAYADRVDDGAWFGVLLSVGAAIAAGVAYWLAGRVLGDRERTVWTRRLGWLAGTVALAAVAVVFAVKGGAILDEFRGTGGKEVSQTPTRLAELSSSNRWRWWQEAWTLWKDAPLAGKGAATFEVARRDIRQGSITTTEPHNVALQFLAETGIVGFLLLLGAIGTGATAAVCAVRRAEGGERAAAAALALGLGAYVLHGLVDIHWEFVAVTAPAFFVLGALIGLCARRRARVSRPVWVLAGVAGLGVLYSLVAPYSSARLVDSAYSQLASDRSEAALSDARAARTLDPLATDPLYALGDAEASRRDEEAALRHYRQAVDLEPENSSTWYALGSYEFFTGRYKEALHDLDRAYGLDPYGPAGRPGGLLDQARAKVLGGG
jgi:O-antigen ligase/polysaccharide polymerase Wzy-like membrane protein/tetratricopeptide repeat protein